MATAKINLEYAVRMILFCGIILFLGGWSLFDGAVHYPRQNVEYDQMCRELEGQKLTGDAFAAEKIRRMREKGWNVEHVTTRAGQPLHSETDIQVQFFFAALLLPWGLLVSGLLFRNSRRRFSADEAGLHGFLPETVSYAAIQSVDRRKWDSKGIVRLTVTTATGEKKLTLDDWKFRGMTDILAEIDRNRPDLAPPPSVSETTAEEAPPVEADKQAPPTE